MRSLATLALAQPEHARDCPVRQAHGWQERRDSGYGNHQIAQWKGDLMAK